jgi:catechol-2,3-dioxygenase
MTDRRSLLKGLGGAGLAAWIGLDLLAEAPSGRGFEAPASTRRGILRLRLRASRLAEMAAFYGEVMGFAVQRSPRRLTVKAGGTLLEFEEAAEGERPVYHVAWAIPENKLALAKAWLAARTPLLVHPDGRNEFHFRSVNRHAVYFADPAGNVLELIARHNLDDGTPGPFTRADILYVNHAGLVVDDLPGAVGQLKSRLGLALRAEPTPQFVQIGDEHRHLVLVTRKRLWLPEEKVPAEVFPTEIALHGSPASRLAFERYPYQVTLET